MLIESVFTFTLVLILPFFMKSEIKSSFWNVSLFAKKTGGVHALPSKKYIFGEGYENLRIAAYNYNKKENLSL
jgi:hypothetical protein